MLQVARIDFGAELFRRVGEDRSGAARQQHAQVRREQARPQRHHEHHVAAARQVFERAGESAGATPQFAVAEAQVVLRDGSCRVLAEAQIAGS